MSYFNSYSRLKRVGVMKTLSASSLQSPVPLLFHPLTTRRTRWGLGSTRFYPLLHPFSHAALAVARGCRGRAGCWVAGSRGIDEGEPRREHQPHTHTRGCAALKSGQHRLTSTLHPSDCPRTQAHAEIGSQRAAQAALTHSLGLS